MMTVYNSILPIALNRKLLMNDELGRDGKQSSPVLSHYLAGVSKEIHDKPQLELSGSEPRIGK
jgi:hypothetical protein